MTTHLGRSIRWRLERHRKNAEAVCIRREPLDPFATGAFVVAVAPDLVLLKDVTDLSADGFKIVRIRDISRIDRRDSERWFEEILRREGIVDDARAPFKIDLSTWKSAIGAIKGQSRNVIIEDESPDDDLFVIGKVSRLNARTLSIRPFDAVGHWELNDHVIPYSRITAVTFDDRYTTLCSKHVRE